MQACCPTCQRLCPAWAGKHKGKTRQREHFVLPHKQPVCPHCQMLAIFVTDDVPGFGRPLIHGGGHFTCINDHAFDEPIDGRACQGFKTPI